MSENKTVFEQLEDVQKDLKELKEKQKSLVDQLNEDDPKTIEFVKTAKRGWRYNGEKSQLKRENQKVKKRSIIGLILLAIYLICSFLFITKPYGWILPIFSSIVCVGQGIIQIFKMCPREYELEYNEIPSFWRYAELDDNDIISATKDKWWVILLRVALAIIPLALAVEIFVFFWLEPWMYLAYIFIVLFPFNIQLFKDSTIYGYQLHFINDKNDIKYFHLKEFMTRNNLK